ncbi:MAG TPA: ADP-ribosylglycohydrolase family protein, partial [Limnochordia bacterium]|nr:ADP-ribosylglycohydrolase family protein [Limnochordia bacterium]
SWLNYIVPERTILWWGGLGMSTEHTAFLRLKSGIRAPQSGSLALNGPVVAEQIGAQIFIDGWAMVAPGDPERAAELARRAGQVSHDGEAVYAAQVLAAMEALAFVETDLQRLLDTAVGLIPHDSTIYRMIDEIRGWAAAEPDWRKARARLAAKYGYDQYPGNCHVVPNHGLIHLSLLYGRDDFLESLMIVNTCGWDTDCNSGNVGCLLAIKNGLAALEPVPGGPDWRGPVADRLYLSTADGGRAITDALTECVHIVNSGRALAGLPPLAPKGGARFHFEAPGAVQGFQVDVEGAPLALENVAGHSRKGSRSLALRAAELAPGRAARCATATFILPEAINLAPYRLLASPTLHSGQRVRAGWSADAGNCGRVQARLFVRVYNAGDQSQLVPGAAQELAPGEAGEVEWVVPDTGGAPIAQIGVEVAAAGEAPAVRQATVYLDYLDWSGAPRVRLGRPEAGGTLWRRAFVDAVDHFRPRDNFQLSHDAGVGLLSQGNDRWVDYRVRATITPYLAKGFGLAVRVQGLRRYYALVLGADQKARLIRVTGTSTVLAETDFAWRPGEAVPLALEIEGDRLQATVGGARLEARDPGPALKGGAAAFLCEEGSIVSEALFVEPLADN